jgi:DNA-binding FadR family transcriptional regulator
MKTPPKRDRRRKRKSSFQVKWVKLPVRWVERLRAASAGPATYQLAHAILVENFKLEQMAVKEIVLSERVTGLSPGGRREAIKNLVRLNLIKIKRGKGKAVRVVDLYI